MKNNHYLICYDISDKKRLTKVGRYLRQSALPLQLSVVYLAATSEELDIVFEGLELLINNKSDDIRAYSINGLDHIQYYGESLEAEGVVSLLCDLDIPATSRMILID